MAAMSRPKEQTDRQTDLDDRSSVYYGIRASKMLRTEEETEEEKEGRGDASDLESTLELPQIESHLGRAAHDWPQDRGRQAGRQAEMNPRRVVS